MTTARPFRFGVVAGGARTGSAWLDTARRVEALGYGTLLTPDTRYTPSPFVALAAAAAVTSTLHLGTWVLASPFRTPGAVAREASALQLVSDGRLELGLGTGRPDAAAEAEALGVPWGSPGERLRRVLETVERVRDEVAPAPSVLIAAAGPRALAAAGVADAVALAVPPQATRADLAAAVETVRAGGSDPEIALQLSGYGGRLVAYLERQGLRAADLPDAAGVLAGGPDEAAEALLTLRADLGISYVSIALELAEDFAAVLPRLLDPSQGR